MRLPSRFSKAKAPVPVAVELATPTEELDAPQADKGKRPNWRQRFVALFVPLGRELAKIPHPPWRSKRGIFVLFLLIAGFGAVAGVGGMTAISFSETPGFCGMCHTMDPELKAYAMSPHSEVTCAECHINPGLAGFVKAKANGTKQLYDVLTGKFPTPVPPPDHADLPPVQVTCLKCHSLDRITENGGPVKLVLRPRFRPDETNTPETVAIMLRPAGLGTVAGATTTPGEPDTAVKGVHWHVQQKVTYTTSDIRSAKIDLVEMKDADGTTKQYIAGSQVSVSEDVKPDIERLKSSQTTKVMDCIDCHNRIGHGVPSPDRSVDEAMSAGRISTALPYVKRNSVALLNGNYPSLAAADTAIEGLQATYEAKYPLIAKKDSKQVTAAIAELKTEYRLVATPAMKVQAKTYPDNLGHQTSPGCFRCHDGGHYLVVKGKITNEKIPSECSTCHTFPQIGTNATKPAVVDKAGISSQASLLTDFPLGNQPAAHKDKLYVFNHKNATKSADPTGTSCAACHTPSYCANCHNSGAVKITHDNMLTKHAASIRAAGSTQACAYCHQAVSCAICHKDKPVLTGTPPAAIKTEPTP